jgi:hypothetical protein
LAGNTGSRDFHGNHKEQPMTMPTTCATRGARMASDDAVAAALDAAISDSAGGAARRRALATDEAAFPIDVTCPGGAEPNPVAG